MRKHLRKHLLSKYLLSGVAASALAWAPLAAYAQDATTDTTTTDGTTTTDAAGGGAGAGGTDAGGAGAGGTTDTTGGTGAAGGTTDTTGGTGGMGTGGTGAGAGGTTMGGTGGMGGTMGGGMTSEPTLISGTVVRYYVDRTGYVTAMDVQTANGIQMVTFPANRATTIYNLHPVGGNIDAWVVPGAAGTGQWTAVGTGADRPQVWWHTFAVSDIDWLEAEPYFEAGATETFVSGDLEGVVVNDSGDVLALVLDTGNGRAMVRVPPQVRHVAPGHEGDERVAALFRGAEVTAVGTLEAPRRGGLLGTYNQVFAANTLTVNGRSVGAIGIPRIRLASQNTLLDWNVGGPDVITEEERRAATMGYRTYIPLTTGPVGVGTTTDMGTTGTGTTGAGMAPTSTTTTETQTGRVMVVAADGSMLPVVRKDGGLHIQAADGTLTEINRRDGKYVVPESMTGARMMMVMSDDRQMEMDTVDGNLMVIMPDGSMAPVTLHTP